MPEKSTIRQLLAGLLLLVFTFSIAPKKYLHDAVANHKDKIVQTSSGDGQQVNHAGFICKCDNLVAESPFTDETVHIDFVPMQVFSVQQDLPLYQFYSSTVFFFTRRGPPSLSWSI